MKKLLFIVLIFIIVLLIAAELYVRSDTFARQIRPYMVTSLTDVLGSDVHIGRVRANLIPMYIEARDIYLPDGNGGAAGAVRKIKVYINPVPLLVKKIRLPSISLLEPRIYAERSANGRLNVSHLLDRIQTNMNRMQDKGSSRFQILLKRITINQGSISFKDEKAGTRLTVSRIQANVRQNVAGNIVAVTLKDSEVSAEAAAYPDIAGKLKAALRYDHGRVHVESLSLTTVDSVLAVSGAVKNLPDPEFDLQVRMRSGPQTIRKFSSLLKYFKKQQKSQIEASIAIQGTLSNPAANGTLQFSGISYNDFFLHDVILKFGYREKALTVTASKCKISRNTKSIMVDSLNADIGYSAAGLDVQRLDVQAGDLSLRMSGRADAEKGFDLIVAAESRDKGQTLSFLASVPIEGKISADGHVNGLLNDPVLDGNFSAGPFTVRGIVFDTAAGRLQYRKKKISIVSADIRQKSSRYFFNGSVNFEDKDPLFTARLKVIRSDVRSIVALFYKPLPLHFSATGELSFIGTKKDFTGTGQVTVESGSAYGQTFSKGTVTAVLSKERISFPQVVVDKGDGIVKGSGWIGFNRTYSAAVESHGVRLAEVDLLANIPVNGLFDLFIESSGSFSDPQVTATLAMEKFSFHGRAVGNLTARLLITDKTLTCSAKLAEERARMTARLNLNKPYLWHAESIIEFEELDPFLFSDHKDFLGRVRLTSAGSVSAHGTGLDISTINGTASLQRIGLSIGDYRIENNGAAVISMRGDKVLITSLNLNGQGTKMTVTGGARLFKDVDLSLLGTANLSLLRPLFRDLEHSDGTAEIKLAISDEWNNPDVAGELLVKNGEIKIKDMPQKISALAGKVVFDQKRIMVETLTGEIGGGTLSASGKAQLSGARLSDFSTRVAFENVTFRFPEGLVSTMSGDIYYDGDASEQSLTGDISIKRARYDKRVEWKSMLVDVGKGLRQKRKTETGWVGDTKINVRFYGKENILFQNNLAKVPLDVDVFVRGNMDRPQLLGRIEARKGSVYFRQNEFRILHASVDFVDPNRVNPVLDIQAQIQVREYLVRLAVSGTADRAVVTLLSDPSLSDSDILALLALGKTGSELKGRETGVGMSEAASFATGQFQDIFENRARSLTGLDRFQVDPYVSKGDTSVPRVTVGKEIVQDKLYVTYSSNVGSTMPEQIFRIEYILNKSFSLVGERNELGNTGADIKYRFEFK